MSRESVEPRQVEPAARTTSWAYVVGLVVSLTIALVVILTAIDVQSARIPDSEGHGWPFSRLFGPDFGSGLNFQGWTVLTTSGELTPDGLQRFQDLLVAHVSVDAAFALVYTLLLIILIRAVTPAGWWRRVSLAAIAGLLLADLVENVFASLVAFGSGGLRVLLIATTMKWVLVGVVVAILVLSLVVPRSTTHRPSPQAKLRRAIKAVVHQRFSYLPVVAIFVLSIPAGAAILEQLPDVQRRWVFDGGTGVRHAVAAMAATLLLAGFLLVIGRRRTRYALRHPTPDIPPTALGYAARRHPVTTTPTTGRGRPAALDAIKANAYFGIWLIPPIAALIGVILTVIFSDPDLILRTRVAIFIAVPLLLVVVGSAITRRVWKSRPSWTRPDRPPEFDPDDASAVGIAGSVAGLGAIVVGGLSLLRAYVPLVVLPATDRPGQRRPTASAPGDPAVDHRGAAVVAPWLMMIFANRRFGGPTRRKIDSPSAPASRSVLGATSPSAWGSWILLAAVGVFVALGVFPRWPPGSAWPATATLALGSMAGMLSAVALLIQDRPTAEIFRVVRLRRSPLVTLLALTLVLVSLSAARAASTTSTAAPPRPVAGDTRLTMAASFDAWLETPEPCEIQVGGQQVRPMLLIAAEGGGIRAAYWTVRGLQAIADTTCGERSALFSAGASGGSVGLTVARFSGTPDEPNTAGAVDAVKQMAAPRDPVPGRRRHLRPRPGLRRDRGAGAALRRARHPFTWKDRARLIEDGWADAPGAAGWTGATGTSSPRADQLSPPPVS